MEPVIFKGSKNGVSMVIDAQMDFEELCEIITQKLEQAKDFLGEGTKLVINSGDRALNEGEQLALKVLLKALNKEVKEFVSNEVATDAEEVELSTESTETIGGNLTNQAKRLETYFADGSCLIIRKNIRSGQSIDFDGTLVIFGDVNAGAEIRATGHILVMGALRGMAHAGWNNNQEAIVYANKLLPIQLRIAELIARAPDNEDMDLSKPEIARIEDGRLIIEACF